MEDIFKTQTPKLGITIVTELTNTASDVLIDSVVNDVRGFYSKSQQLPRLTLIKIMAIIGLGIASAFLFIAGQSLYGILSIVIAVLVTVISISDELKKF